MTADSPSDTPEQDSPNQEHLAILLRGVNAWNAWRKEYPTILPDLRGINWSRADLDYVNLSGADLEKANLRQSNLRWASLRNANLAGIVLRASDLTGADLTGANLTGADIRNTKFSALIRTLSRIVGGNVIGAIQVEEFPHLTQDQLKSANGNWQTSLPPGFTYPDHWEKEPEPFSDSPPSTPEDGPNLEHLAMLRQGVGAWNKWRAENPDVRPNLVGSDLSGINFAGNALTLPRSFIQF